MMVECSKKTDGKILNALYIPQPFESRERTQFASDIHALIATLNGMGWKPGMSLHNEDFRWAIASLKGAFHGFHLDSDGLGTFIQALFGSKWWILASPKPGSNADFAKINYALLSDRDGKVMQTYGVYDEPRRVAKRSYIIVDKEGVIRYLNIRPGNTEKDLLSTEELLSEVKKVNSGK